MTRAQAALVLALAATLLAAYFAPQPADDGVALSDRARQTAGTPGLPGTPARRSAAAPPPEVLGMRPRDIGDDDPASVFASTQWTPDAPKPVVAAPPQEPVAPADAAPVAPPLPFRVLGRFVEEGMQGAFLQYNDQNLVVRVGDTIGEHYKVESLDAARLVLRYGPLNEVQTLNLGGSH